MTLAHCYREKHQSSSSQRCGQFTGFKSGGLQHLRYPSREGLHWQIHDVKGLKERLLREWRLLDHSIAVVIAQWRSRLSPCVHVNGGNFEHKLWTYDCLVCFVPFINTGFHKFDWYKHVQSANVTWNVLLLCLWFLQGTVATKWACDRKFLYHYFGILLRSCACKIMKIGLYL